MEIFFNELSIQPMCRSEFAAKEKIMTLLATLKALKSYEFNVMRTHNNFYAEDLGNGYSVSAFINDPDVKPDIKLLLRSIVKNPFIADDESDEAPEFILNNYTTIHINGTTVFPEGLTSAYLYYSPVISLVGHELWENPSIPLTITVKNIATLENIVNTCSVQSLNSEAFISWYNSLTEELPFDSVEHIYSVFPRDLYDFQNKALEYIISWQYDNKRFIVRIKQLIKDISDNPFMGGKGDTEVLNNGLASKRINKKDRLIYTYSKDKITIHQCRGHYDDH